MHRSSIFWSLSALTSLILIVGLALTVGGSGGAFAQDDPTPAPDRGIEVAQPELVAQIEASAPVNSMITVDGQPFVVTDDGTLSRGGPGGLEPVTHLPFLYEDVEWTYNWDIINAWPVRGGGTTFLAKFDGIDGEAVTAPGVILPDGSLTLLTGGPGADMLIMRSGPGGTSTLSLTDLGEIIPTLSFNYEKVEWTVRGGGTTLIKFDGIEGESYTGWFDHSGTFNVVGVVEYQDGDDLFLVKGDPGTGTWDTVALGDVQYPGNDWAVFPHADGGLTIIAVELDGGRKAYAFDANGGLFSTFDLPDRLDSSQQVVFDPDDAFGYPQFIMQTPAGDWQVVRLDPVNGVSTTTLQGIPDGFTPRPDVFQARGGGGTAFMAIQDGTSNTIFFAHLDLRGGGGTLFDDPLVGFDDPLVGFDDSLVGFDDPLVGTVSPDGTLFVNIDQSHDIVRLDPNGTVSQVFSDALPGRFQDVSGLTVGADGLLYVSDRSGTVSVFEY